MVNLPGGFSPLNALKQLGTSNLAGQIYSQVRGGDATPDFDVFGDYSVRGGDRSPANGAYIGPQSSGEVRILSGNPGYVPRTSRSGNTLSDTDLRTNNTPSISAQDLALYDQSIGIVNSALGRLPSQINIARDNVNDQYGVGVNELNSSRKQAENSYKTSSTQNQQSYRGDKNAIADQASQGLRGLLRMLGAFGAGGSSEAQFVAPEAVAQHATLQRSGAGQTFSENQQGLDTNWGNFQTQEENERQKLADWKNLQLRNAELQNTQNKIDLISQLAQLTQQRAAALDGDVEAAGQPFINQVNQLSERVNSLGRFSPQYQGNTPVYQAKPLDSYNSAQTQATPQTNALQSTTSPYLAALLGAGQEERRRVGF